jgi:hypothetical protein
LSIVASQSTRYLALAIDAPVITCSHQCYEALMVPTPPFPASAVGRRRNGGKIQSISRASQQSRWPPGTGQGDGQSQYCRSRRCGKMWNPRQAIAWGSAPLSLDWARKPGRERCLLRSTSYAGGRKLMQRADRNEQQSNRTAICVRHGSEERKLKSRRYWETR